MTVLDFIKDLDSKVLNDYTKANKLVWINDIEQGTYQDSYEEFRVQYYNRQKNVYQLTLPSGVTWDDIYSLFVDGEEYDKRNVRHYDVDNSYWYENSKINLHPVPDTNDTEYVSSDIIFKAIEYESGAGEITFTDSTIVTTGDSFVDAGFVIGNSIDITGCTENTGNNQTAVITAVTADTLTFDSVFTAGEEEGVITIKTNCIYTEGHDFSGFSVDDIALVSGCTDETSNNKYARIAAVYDTVLTFAEGTFTAQDESGEVTIKAPKIKLVYRYIPTEKLIANIATDTLSLPRRFQQAYYYYCYAQIAYLQEEYDKYDNHMRMYNKVMADYDNWWENRRPMKANTQLSDGWGNDNE